MCTETCLLAWEDACVGLKNGEGDGERAPKSRFVSLSVSSSVGDPGSIAVTYDSHDSHDSRSCRRSVRRGLIVCDAMVVSVCDVAPGFVLNFPVASSCVLVLRCRESFATSEEGSR